MADPSQQPTLRVAGTRLTLLADGPLRLDRLIELIDGAERTLRGIYYIYADDDAGQRVRDALLRAAQRGVRTSLIVDGMGSEKAAADGFFQPLDDAGVHVCHFSPRWGRRYLLRNHQKLVLADEERAIIGGFNVEQAYFGRARDQAWRDLGLLIEGPAAAHAASYFDAVSDWSARHDPPLRDLRHILKECSQGEGPIRWLFGGPTSRLSPWARALRGDLLGARKLDLIAGYFAPNPAMLRRLDRIGKEGSARIVLPSKNDHVAAIWASRFTYAGLLRKHVEIFEYQPTKLHTKLFVIDDVVYIGSANFDIRSMFLNLELMLRVEDPAFAAHVRTYFDGEVAHSTRITKEAYRRTGWWMRVKQAGAYFVITVLDYNVTRRLNFGVERGPEGDSGTPS